MTGPGVIAYMNPWHLGRSSAFESLLIGALPAVTFEKRSILDYRPGESRRPVVFCQDLPEGGLPATVRTPHSWIPMVDGRGGVDGVWENVPVYLRIVAFSDRAAALADRTGLPVCRLRFFTNPHEVPRAEKPARITLMHWNRTNLMDVQALLTLCEALQVGTLLLRNHPDPTMPDGGYARIGSRHGGMTVENLPSDMSRADYLRTLQRAHIFVAPRHVEGVGVTFIEAMAHGCAVIAVDHFTMNEYVRHGRNGFLLDFDDVGATRNTLAMQQRRILGKTLWGRCRMARLKVLGRLAAYRSLVTPASLPIDALKSADWIRMGRQAESDHAQGFEDWKAGLDRFAAFIL